jgi:hypothetical protein
LLVKSVLPSDTGKVSVAIDPGRCVFLPIEPEMLDVEVIAGEGEVGTVGSPNSFMSRMLQSCCMEQIGALGND